MPQPPSPRAPFRLRPSRRTILLACILLLVGGGAIVNVAVAWVLALRMDPFAGRVSAGLPTWHVPPLAFNRLTHADDVLRTETSRSFGVTVSVLVSEWPGGAGWVGCATYAFGFPARSLAMARYVGRDDIVDQSMRWLGRPSGTQRPFEVRGAIPTRPLTFGFAINTLFYTAILALPLSFFPIRRRLRARRGRCPACGYDLTGAPAPGGGNGRGGVCPECGAGRRDVVSPPQAEGLERK